MPNTKSAIRRTRKTKQQTFVNKIRKSKYKAANKKMTMYIKKGKIKEARQYLSKFHSELMKIAKSGVVDKKTAARKISRVAKKINNPQTKQSI